MSQHIQFKAIGYNQQERNTCGLTYLCRIMFEVFFLLFLVLEFSVLYKDTQLDPFNLPSFFIAPKY